MTEIKQASDSSKQGSATQALELPAAGESTSEEEDKGEGRRKEDGGRQRRKPHSFRRRTPSVTASESSDPPINPHRDLPTNTHRDEAYQPADSKKPHEERKTSHTDSALPVSSTRSLVDPVSIYSDMPSSKFYDTKLNPVHLMSTEDIDRELKEIEAIREDGRTTMSDFLANQLKRINDTRLYNTTTSTYSTQANAGGIELPIFMAGTSPQTNVPADLTGVHVQQGTTVTPSLSFQPSYSKALPSVVLDGNEYLDKVMGKSFLDVVDIDKRAFGEGPLKERPFSERSPKMRERNEKERDVRTRDPATADHPRAFSVDELMAKRPGAMHARLDALADQLDQIEQSAHALQHDLAFSVKVVNNINVEQDLSVPVVFTHPPALQISTSSPKVSRSLPSTPTSAPSSPRFPTSPKHHHAPARGQIQLINQHTQQRIQDAMELIGRGGDSTKRGYPYTNATGNSPPVGRKAANSPPVARRDNSPPVVRKTGSSPPVARKSGNWHLPTTSGTNDQLSDTQIQKLLSLTSTATLNESSNKPVDWDELEKILQE